MTCPQDKESLYEIFYDNADIKVDVCKECQGVWLDSGEYENIIAFLKRTVFREDVSEYLKHLEDQIKECNYVKVSKKHFEHPKVQNKLRTLVRSKTQGLFDFLEK